MQSTHFSLAQTSPQINTTESSVNATLLIPDNSTSTPPVNATLLMLNNTIVSAEPEMKPQKPSPKEKFDSGFEKKINDMILAGETREYDVIILVKKAPENGLDAKLVAKNNKIKLENELIKIHKAKNVYKGEVLSFVTASIPLYEIQKLADYDFVYLIGDGERRFVRELNVARPTVNAENLPVNGSGVRVAVIDSGINQTHPDFSPLANKIVAQTFCHNTGSCVTSGEDFGDAENHGTHVAGIIAGFGNLDSTLRGFAPRALLLNAKTDILMNSTGLAKALDWSLINNAKVINISSGVFPNDTDPCGTDVENTMVDETVDEGALVVKSAGNQGPLLGSITDPGCAFNVIAVGAMDDHNDTNRTNDSIDFLSSRGSTYDGRLKPEIVAPGININSPDSLSNYSNESGTSFAAAVVSGSAALVLETRPEYSPLEVKAALLIGAEWKAAVPMNATAYENGGSLDNNLNTFGLGYLDVNKTITLANTSKNIKLDTITENQSKRYAFSANQNDQVKVILSWLKHPLGNVTKPENVTTSNLDFVITRSDNGATVTSSTSMKQNNEFSVFKAPITGNYTVTVFAQNVDPQVGSAETFALASTHALNKASFNAKEGMFTKITTGLGSQTISGLGFKPKAVILYTTRQTAEGTTDIYNLSIGISNGTSSRSIGVASDDNAASSNAGRAFGTKALRILSSGNPTVSAEADVSFTSDGFTVNWTTNDSTASIIHYIALGGEEITNSALSSFVANISTGNQVVSNVGFTPDFVMFMHAASTSETGTATHGYLSYGFAVPAKRGSVAVASEDGRATMDTWSYQRTDKAIIALTESSGAIDAEADIVSMNTNGFTINWSNAPASADRIYYLALKGGQYDVGNFAKTTAAAPVTQAVSTTFQPKALILSSFNNVSSTVVKSNDRLSFGSASGTNQGAIWAGDRDAAANSITARSTTTSKVIRLATEQATGSSSTINAEANIVSMNPTNFTINWTTNDSVARQIIYAVFGRTLDSNIIIVEDTIPDSGTDFTFTSSNFTSFTLDDDTNTTYPNTKILSNLLPGTYNIAQNAISDYTTTTSCSDGSTINAISVGTNETVTCRFENAYIPRAGLVAEWKFEDNATDTSANSNDGTVNGATYVNGKVGRALSFDGINDYVNVTHHSTLNPSTISISFWIKPNTGITIDSAIVSKFTNAITGYFAEVGDPTDKWIRFSIPEGGTNPNFHSSIGSVVYDQWTHVVAIRNSTNHAKIYINGAQDGSSTLTGTIESTNDLNIGRNTVTGGDLYKGLIDQVRIYNRELLQPEIIGLYNEG